VGGELDETLSIPPDPAPQSATVDKLDLFASPLDGMIESDAKRSRTRAALRDSLLPKLMSGELRIRDAEKIVGTHVC
jgi:type I restriction enzyme, S subunit